METIKQIQEGLAKRDIIVSEEEAELLLSTLRKNLAEYLLRHGKHPKYIEADIFGKAFSFLPAESVPSIARTFLVDPPIHANSRVLSLKQEMTELVRKEKISTKEAISRLVSKYSAQYIFVGDNERGGDLIVDGYFAITEPLPQ